MSETTTEKPVYKTGSNLSEIFNSNEAATTTPITEPVVEATPTPTSEAPIVPITPETPAPTAEVTTPEIVTPQEDNVSTFKLDFEEAPAEEVATPAASVPPATAVTDWREAVKKADKNELFAELGLDPFAVKLNDYIKAGGKAEDFIKINGVDYTKMSDLDIIKADLREQFPNATSAQLELWIQKTYSQGELAEEEDKEFGTMKMMADANKVRQQKIAEQANFKIPEPIQVQSQVNNEAAQKEAELEQQRRIQETVRYFAEHEATKNLMTSKRVALNLGDNGTFNFNVERPELLMKAITDGSVWQKLTATKQGEPDVAKMQKIALYAFNPEQFEADLVNYGKTLGLSKLVEEGQNITKGAIRTLPAHNANETEKEAWAKRAKSGTLGGG